MELQLDATITVLLILEINNTVIVASSWSSIFNLLQSIIQHVLFNKLKYFKILAYILVEVDGLSLTG
jgi:hypothetical protein